MTTPQSDEKGRATSTRRLAIGYAGLGLGVAAVIATTLAIGAGFDPKPPRSESASAPILGSYEIRRGQGECFDPEREAGFELKRDASDLYLVIDGMRTPITVDEGVLRATLDCPSGGSAELTARAVVVRQQGTTSLVGALGETDFVGVLRPLSGEETFGRLMLAIAVAILVARLLGALVARMGQPRVMGEVLGGILLGPSLLGFLASDVQAYLFPPSVVPLLTAAADIGLAFYMFLIGLELDPRMLRGRLAQAAFISNASVVVPMALGSAAALLLYQQFGQRSFLPFALFMGVAMSITAFPVLARILTERRMLRRPVGAMALASAAVDDVSAWTLLALATATAMSMSGLDAGRVLLLAGIFSAGMFLVARPFIGRAAVAYEEVGSLPPLWLGVVFVGVLISAYLASAIGVAAIFGAFIMGLIMPRRADLTRDLTDRMESFVVTVLLPLFFVVTGLRTQIGLLDRVDLWLIAGGIIVVAVVAKWGSAMLAARFVGWRVRDAAAIGALMNTRGLTELIVLNIGLELGVIGMELFAMLVLMALVTTLMTGPSLRLIDPSGALSAPPGEEVDAVIKRAQDVERPTPVTHAVLVAPQDRKNLDALAAIAEVVARQGESREVILALLLSPAPLTTGVRRDAARLRSASDELEQRRERLSAQGVPARSVAYISPDIGADLVRLATDQAVDLLLLDGQRPLFGDPVPHGATSRILRDAPCDVAVLVERRRMRGQGEAAPFVVPFSGADHDWAALELAALLAAAERSQIRLVGAVAAEQGGRDASRLLATASLAVQQLSGVPVQTLLIEPGAQGVVTAAEEAGMLVVGLSPRWRDEGLGQVRSEIAQRATASILFVRSGGERSFLQTTSAVTQVAWSRIADQPPKADESP